MALGSASMHSSANSNYYYYYYYYYYCYTRGLHYI